ncbi:AAA family ATPase [Haloarcula sp. CBA1130]|uniref:ATP-binding protein n=1 Tax=unclassified Haloarcula TaxID=2624677 RepID=UPI0012484330|nr:MULTISPECIES: ATP-binding protein [unclassified Haloarcula]KAA9398523.1 AAA family ATPase [Haloarcula sp. CBA1129]KAA9401885.1 AAA family ATPase [Haloarcula sp. CBA1130]
MSSDDLSAAYLSEHIGNEGEVPQWVTYVSSERLQYLLRMEQALPVPEESDTFNQLLKNVKSNAINTAIEEDDLTKVSAIKGVSDNSVDATGYGMLLERLEPAAQTLILKGPKGSGKSTKMSDLAWKAMDEDIVEKCMTNLALEGFKDGKFEEADYDVRYSELISDFLEFAKEPGEKVMLLDELSTVANMLTSSNDAQDIFVRVINALRKSEGGSCRIIAIGHQNPTDILPALRNNADGVIEAPNKAGEGIDRANYYKSYDEYQSGDPEFRVRGMQDVSDHSLWGFDDKTFATLELNLDDPENQIKRGQLIDDWEKYQDGGGEPDDTRVYCSHGGEGSQNGCGASSQQYPELLQDDIDCCPYHRDDDGGSSIKESIEAERERAEEYLDEKEGEEDGGKQNEFMDDSDENVDPNAGHTDDYKW